jgi:hypothetical protein
MRQNAKRSQPGGGKLLNIRPVPRRRGGTARRSRLNKRGLVGVLCASPRVVEH